MLPVMRRVGELVTVEPAVMLYLMSLALVTLGGQNLLLQKVCHPGPNMPAPGDLCSQEKESQQEVADIETWRHVVQLSLPGVFVMFAGPWSDNHGKRRKPLMYIPLCGQILTDILCTANVYFWDWSPVAAALSQVVIQSVTGWRTCFFVGVVCYISDITSAESRTTRIGACTALYFVATPLGAFMFGVIFKNLSFYGVYSATILMNSIALIYLILLVDESRSKNKNATTTTELNTCKDKDLMDPKSVLETLRIIAKPREGYRRSVLVLVFLAAPISMAPLQGEFSVLYLITRIKFNWDVIDYGYYAAYKTIIISFGLLVSLGLMSRILAVPDAAIAVLASATMIIGAAGYAFYSTAVWQFYVWPLVDFMQGSTLPIVSSIASKNVQVSELGRVNAAIGVIDAIFPLFNMPLYAQVYKHTVTQMPGAVFLISLAYGVISLLIFSVVYILQRKEKEKENT